MRSISLPMGEAGMEEPPRGYHKPPGKTPGQIYLKRKVGCGPNKIRDHKAAHRAAHIIGAGC